MFLNLQQRWNRVNDTTHIIYYDDMSIHKVDYIQSLKDCVLVHTEGSLIYQDTDVFTLDEIYDFRVRGRYYSYQIIDIT